MSTNNEITDSNIGPNMSRERILENLLQRPQSLVLTTYPQVAGEVIATSALADSGTGMGTGGSSGSGSNINMDSTMFETLLRLSPQALNEAIAQTLAQVLTEREVQLQTVVGRLEELAQSRDNLMTERGSLVARHDGLLADFALLRQGQPILEAANGPAIALLTDECNKLDGPLSLSFLAAAPSASSIEDGNGSGSNSKEIAGGISTHFDESPLATQVTLALQKLSLPIRGIGTNNKHSTSFSSTIATIRTGENN